MKTEQKNWNESSEQRAYKKSYLLRKQQEVEADKTIEEYDIRAQLEEREREGQAEMSSSQHVDEKRPV